MQGADHGTVTDNWTRNWQASIAVKITAIVIWAIILIAFVLSIFLLKDLDREIQADYELKADQIAYQIAMLWADANSLSDEQLGLELRARFEGLGFTGLVLSAGEERMQVGRIQGYPDSVFRRIPMSREDAMPVDVRAYYPDPHALAREQRNHLTIGLFAVLLVFGVFITWATRIVLHRPLQALMTAIRAISDGDQKVRFDTNRQDEFGTLSRFFNAMLDQLMRQKEALQQALDEAESASRSKSAFLANMSHELRTPLNAIIGYSEMLQEDAAELGNTRSVQDLQRIHTAGRHLLTLINGILDLSKIEAGKMQLDVARFDVEGLVQDVVATLKPIMDANENDLVVHCAPDLGVMESDETKLRQTLFNLLGNAAKFTDQGTVTLEVSRHGHAGEDWLRFVVKDTGIGIPVDQMSRLFQDFSQIDSSSSRKYGGTGLGLAISRRYCQMMGGDIEASSRVGEGSIFVVRLPVASPTLRAGAVAEKAVSAEPITTEVPAVAAGPIPAGGRRILVIDDDPGTRELLGRYLAQAGVEVLQASSGEEGIARARQELPDLITLDVRMPDLNGMTVLRTLKEDPALRQIPVVMVSMEDFSEDWHEAGAAAFLTKPVDRNRLGELVQTCLLPEGDGSVLLVDDNDGTRALIARTLQEAGLPVIEAEDGIRGLELMRRHKPSLVLTDIIMPRMNGFDFLDEIHRDPALCDIPVVVMTALDLSEQDRARLSGRAYWVMEKNPDMRAEILKQIRDCRKATGVCPDGSA
ncbi:MAG: response regulator [Gammaproteobacteria bacterium]|nr:response regulator [Gammaproteobacteria bacterium]